jgi:streptogramin lyase
MVDDQGQVWVGTDDGYVGMRNAEGEWAIYSSDINHSISELFMDREGRVWVWSWMDQGLGQIAPSADNRTIEFTNSGLMDREAVAVTVSQGQLWVFTQNREVKVLEPGAIWRTHATLPNTANNTHVSARLAIDTRGGIWVVSNHGVAVLDPDGTWTVYPLGDLYSTLGITAIIPGPDGRVWVTSAAQGVFAFDPGTGWTNYNSRNSGLSSDVTAWLAYDPAGWVWIGGDQGRLYRWNLDTFSLAWMLPALNLVMQVILPASILSVVLVGLLRPLSGRQEPVTGRNVRAFWFGFAAWFIVNGLCWGWIRYSVEQSSAWILFHPGILIPLPMNILMMFILYRSYRWVALGTFSAFLANWILMILLSPLVAEGSGAFALFMIPFFLPLFLGV